MAIDQSKTDIKDVKKTDVKKSGFHPMEFIQEVRREISKVTWPSRKETVITTITVVAMALIAGVFFFAVDSVLGAAIGRLLGMNS